MDLLLPAHTGRLSSTPKNYSHAEVALPGRGCLSMQVSRGAPEG